MTGLEEDQEFDFDFLFEFNQSDEGAGVAPGGSARVGGAGPKVQGITGCRVWAYRAGVVGLGCIVQGAGVQGWSADRGVQGLDVEGPGVQVLVMQASWVGVLGVRESAGRARSGRARLGTQSGARAAPPSLSAPVSLGPGPQPLPRSGQHHSAPTPVSGARPLWSRRKTGQV